MTRFADTYVVKLPVRQVVLTLHMPGLEPALPEAKIRVRFAPSPTGYPHLGNIRTALFNWLFAVTIMAFSSCASRIPMLLARWKGH